MTRPRQLDPTDAHLSRAAIQDAPPRHHLLRAYRSELFGAMPGICGRPTNLHVCWALPFDAAIESALTAQSLIDEPVYRPAVA